MGEGMLELGLPRHFAGQYDLRVEQSRAAPIKAIRCYHKNSNLLWFVRTASAFPFSFHFSNAERRRHPFVSSVLEK